MLIAHGYPPRETAGTERHVSMLAHALQERGHIVQVVAATRAPGRNQYAVSEEAGVVRIVNNIATRALADAESDTAIDTLMAGVEGRFKPDVVHIHHIQFLSSSMQFNAPTVITLHDQWAWCAAGGLSLQDGTRPCPGPTPDTCAPCHAGWRPGPSPTARMLTRGAGLLAPVIAPERLHAAYRKLPAWARPRPVRAAGAPESGAAAKHRNEKVLGFFNRTHARISPSRYLAERAESNGLRPVEVIPHGLDESWFGVGPKASTSQPFVHLGTVSFHKGTDRVVAAWRLAFPDGDPTLLIHGPVLDPDAALGHPVGEVLEPDGIRKVLRNARALVLGARWPENAPLIILEARAVGCPVIAPAIGGIPEILEDGRDGILVPPEDDAGLVAALRSAAADTLPTPTPPPRFAGQVDAIEKVYRNVMARPAR